MKFLFIAPNVPLSEIHLSRPYFELPRLFARKGWSSVLVAGKINAPTPKEIKTYETGVGTNRHIDIFRVFTRVLKILGLEQPDMVVFFHMNLLLTPFIVLYKIADICKGFGTNHKTIWLLKLDWDGTRFSDSGKLKMILRDFFLSINSLFLDFLVAENTCGQRATLSLPFVGMNKVVLIPNSYSLDLPILEYSSCERENLVICVGRISPEKGIEILIRSFAKVHNEFPNWNLKLVGPIEDTNYFEKMKTLVSMSGTSTRISFIGPLYRDELRDIYSRAAIFCLPSLVESYGIVRAEAIASGIPLITTSAGCGLDFEKYGSIVVPSGNIEELTLALTRLMRDKETRIRISKLQQSTFPGYIDLFGKYEELMRI